MNPTPEQTTCVDYFNTGRALRINAYAGTGKTSTLKMLARSTRRSGVYLAFNSSVATEAKQEFPRNVRCSTGHGLAFRAMVQRYTSEKMTGKLSAGYIASMLKLPAETVAIGGSEPLRISSRGWGKLVGEAVKRFVQSADPMIARHHAVPGDMFAMIPQKERDVFAGRIVARANDLWQRMIDRNDKLPLTHDGYFKIWAMEHPQIAAEFVLLDEAQDTNGVMLDLMRRQRTQVIAVGDRHQQIYEWRGARNAMVELPADLEARLAMSFRFGPAIAENATAILRMLGEPVPLTGNPERTSTVGEIDNPRCILTRTNATLIAELVKAIDAEQRAHVVGGVSELLMYVDAAETLMNGNAVESPLDFFGFPNWREVEKASETEDGEDLRRWVKLFNEYTPADLRGMLRNLPAQEDGADVIFSTGHKSKGREWPTVRLTDDFLKGVAEDRKAGIRPRAVDHAAELRLYYVACTRGKEGLEIPQQLRTKLAMLEAPAIVDAPQPEAVPVAPIVVTTPPAVVSEFEVITDDVLPPTQPASEFEVLDAAPVQPVQKATDPAEEFQPIVDEEPAPAKARKTYPPRMVKCECPKCGYLVRTTRKWLDVALPECPVDKVPLAVG